MVSSTAVLSAQPERNQKFAAAGHLGLSLAQIHGDSYAGYNKAGVRFGIETHYLWKPKYFLSLGLGFSQEGARPNSKEIDAARGSAIGLSLSLVEIPLLFNYRLVNKKATGRKDNHALYRSRTLQLGVKLTRLVGFTTRSYGFFDQQRPDLRFTEADIEFQDFDFAVVGGMTFQLGIKYALFVQHSLSVRGLYKPDEVEALRDSPYDVVQLRPYSLTFGGKVLFY